MQKVATKGTTNHKDLTLKTKFIQKEKLRGSYINTRNFKEIVPKLIYIHAYIHIYTNKQQTTNTHNFPNSMLLLTTQFLFHLWFLFYPTTAHTLMSESNNIINDNS